MDKEYKTKFDTVLDEFKSRVEQSGYDKDSDELIKPSQLFANSSYGKMLLSVTEDREVAEPPLLKKSALAGSISKVLEDVRAKMSDEVANRITFIFQLLGTTVEQQEENFKKLPMHQRWLFKAWIYASASLEYIAFGASKMYKKVVAWIKSINGNIGMDVFHIPEELPSLDDAYKYLNDKFDIEKQLGPMFNPK